MLKLWLAVLPLAMIGGAALAGEWDYSATVSGELRVFPNKAAFSDQDNSTLSPSLSFKPEVIYEWNGGDDRLTFVPFLRWDADDDNRSHGDIREANWLHLADDWDLIIGVDKIFWGVTESRHLVDIINQNDAVENIDGEDKLGQPMINLNLFRDWGALSAFVLPGFRERSFPDDTARLRGSLPIDDGKPTYESGAEDRHVDFALRWTQTYGDWDLGLSHFSGTSREPRLIEGTDSGGRTVLTPQYDQIDQTSLDLQLTRDAWLWKLEAVTRSGHGDRFVAAVGGFEYTLFGVMETNVDLGFLAEYLYDGRDNSTAPGTAADDDIFLGIRLALNDEPDSSLLIGATVDRRSQATLFFIEAERRLGDSWTIELEGGFFLNVPGDDLFAGIQDDDVLTLRLTKFF